MAVFLKLRLIDREKRSAELLLVAAWEKASQKYYRQEGSGRTILELNRTGGN